MLNLNNSGNGKWIPAGQAIIEAGAAGNETTGAQLYWITQRDKNLIRQLRQSLFENQTAFWGRFGVTQTQGSRFERGKAIPLPVLLLMRLYLLRIVSETDLQQVRCADFGAGDPL